MIHKHLLKTTSLLFAVALSAAACGSDSTSAGDDTTTTAGGGGSSTTASSASDSTAESAGGDLSGDVVISGSSTVEPISVDVAENFKSLQPGVNVSVSGPGTGDGFKEFCVGNTDISDASRKIKDEEAATCKENGINYVEMQVGIDGIAVLTNPENAAVSCLSFPDLYALLGPESTGFGKWSDANELDKEVGGDGSFPDADLVISAPGTESGTYDSFIELALAKIAEGREADSGTTRPDYSSAADDNVIIETISSNPTSLGWVGFAYADQASGVKLVPVSAEAGGDCIEANAETIASGEYPLSRGLYIYVNSDKAAESDALRAFVDHYMDYGLDTAVTQADYVALTDDVKAESRATWGGV